VRPPRRGERRRLMAEHGAGMPMPELRRVLAGDCERMKAGKFYDPCGCHFPDLPGPFGGVGEICAARHNPLRRG
jgi:hypothetical protein